MDQHCDNINKLEIECNANMLRKLFLQRNPKIYPSVQKGVNKRGEHWSTFDPTFELFTFLNKTRLKYGTSTDIKERALVTATIITL